jgi:diadenosine tetraphosphatase ApaH/serine/threonine PP2A family protein phosphatase
MFDGLLLIFFFYSIIFWMLSFSRNMNKVFGFLGEITHKYDRTVMDMFTKVFNWLPLASVIEDKVFVVHGGLSTQEGGVRLDQIETLPRNKEPGDMGLMTDLLWADPQRMMGRSPSKRGLGYSFGPDYTDSFLAMNNLQLLIRSHEMQEEGYVCICCSLTSCALSAVALRSWVVCLRSFNVLYTTSCSPH